ncbi:MAG TPA: aldo/keto reductase [Isosphaeraceae bacterium]|jgi:aryl-alcohol dehydrogenase-like predicted oxidoreductase|nr:aldo/keto reductase [Isosphaeraceae bacterium]
MRYHSLGPTGVLISELCLGTMTFGEGWGIGGIDLAQADTIVGRALDAGINFIDTADVYSEGQSETLVGQALHGDRRDRVVLATKAFGRMGKGANDAGLTRYRLVRACEASLKRLATDRIDLYQVHGFDALTPLDETVRALDDLVRSGKVLYVGVSNYAAWQIALALGNADTAGCSRFVSAQMYYSLVGRDVEHEVIPLCQHEKLALLPWSPLAGGFLSGKYRRDQAQHPAGSRFSTSKFGEFPPVDKELVFKVVERLIALAEQHHTTPAAIALKWLLDRPAVTSVITGVRRLEQLEANIAATTLALPAEEMALLDAMTAPAELYPNWMIRRQGQNRVF